MDTVALWEEEIEYNEIKEQELEEAAIYNFFGDPVDESMLYNLGFVLGVRAWTALPLALVTSVVNSYNYIDNQYKKAFENFEKEHENDKDFIKASEFDTKIYDLKLTSNQLDKEHKASNKFEKFIEKTVPKDKRIKLFSGLLGYNNKALCFIKEDKIYFYLVYNVENTDIRSTFFATSDVAKKYQDYYMVYACRKFNFESSKIREWQKRYA